MVLGDWLADLRFYLSFRRHFKRPVPSRRRQRLPLLTVVSTAEDRTLLSGTGAPELQDDSYDVSAATPVQLDVLANDSSPTGNTFAITAAGAPQHGTAELIPDQQGTAWQAWETADQSQYADFETFVQTTGLLAEMELHYTPEQGYTGTDSFTYTVEDDQGNSSTASVSLTVHSAVEFSVTTAQNQVTEDTADADSNQATFTISHSGTLAEGESASVNVVHLLRDTDASDYVTDPIDAITAAADADPTVDFDGTTLTFHHIAENTGSVSQFAGTASGVGTGAADWQNPANAADGTSSTWAAVNPLPGESSNQLRLSDFDLDLPDDAVIDGVQVTLTTSGSADPLSTEISLTTDGVVKTAVKNPAGAGWTTGSLVVGDADDDWGQTWTAAQLNSVDFGVLVEVDGGDVQVDSVEITVAYTVPARATNSLDFTVELADNAETELEQFSVGLYNPLVSDNGSAGVATSAASLDVVGSADPPVAVNDDVTTYAGEPLELDVTINDSIPIGSASIVSFSPAAHGTITQTGPSGGYVYTPADGFVGTDAFNYTITDEHGRLSSATVNVTVVTDPGAPIAADDTLTVLSGQQASLDLLGNDSSPVSSALTVVAVSGPDNGIVAPVLIPNTDSDAWADWVSTWQDSGLWDTYDEYVADNFYHDGHLVDGYTYTSDPGFVGTDTFTYTLEDEQGRQVTASVSVTVDALPGASVTADDSFAVTEDTPTLLDVLANDTETDGEPFTLVNVGAATSGTVAIATNPADGVIYRPHADFTGSDSFTYTVEDQFGTQSTSTVTVTVTADSENPIATADAFTVYSGQSIELDLLSNDTSPAGSQLTIESIAEPTEGSIEAIRSANTSSQTWNDWTTVHEASGAWDSYDDYAASVGADDAWITIGHRYVAAADFIGTDTFEYVITDTQGRRTTGTVNVTVDPLPAAPATVADSFTVTRDSITTLDVLANDTETAGTTFELVAVGTATNGFVMIAEDSAQGIEYTPDADFTGTDTFTYTVEDEYGTRTTETVTVTVIEDPDVPTASDDSYTVYAGNSVELNLLDNDNSPIGSALTIVSDSPPSDGHLDPIRIPDPTAESWSDYDVARQAAEAGGGSLTYEEWLDANPDVIPEYVVTGYIYHADVEFEGNDTFTYTIEDEQGRRSTATVTITVNPLPGPPTAEADDVTVYGDQVTTVDVLANDTTSAATLTLISAAGAASGTVALAANPQDGVVYTPDAGFLGTDSFTYVVEDEFGTRSTATVTLTVVEDPDRPLAQNDSYTVAAGGTVTLDLLSNDSSPVSSPLTVVSVGTPVSGTVDPVLAPNPNSTAYIAWQDHLTTSGETETQTPFETWLAANPSYTGEYITTGYTYTAASDFAGIVSFSYTMEDDQGRYSSATVYISSDTPPAPPAVSDDSFTVYQDQQTTLDVVTNDNQTANTPFALVSVGTASHGTVTLAADPADGVVYTPNADFLGTDSFTYTVEDQYGTEATATVTITVTTDPDTPVATDDVITVVPQQTVTLDPLANDTSPAGADLILATVFEPEHGSVSLVTTPDPGSAAYIAWQEHLTNTGETEEQTPFESWLAVNPSHTAEYLITEVTYTADSQYLGTDTIVYIVTDDAGRQASGTITVTVIPLPGTPGTTDDSFTVNGGASATLDVLANDTETDSTPFTLVDPGTATSGTVSIAADPADGIVYTPDTGFSGTDTFTYTVEDSYGTQNTATVTVTVQAVPLVLTNDSVAMANTGLPLLVDVLANDSGAGVTLSSVTQPANGTVSIDASGKLVYTAPNSGWSGTDTLTYTVVDEYGAQSTATVTMNVTADGGEGVVPNAVPVGGADSAATFATQPVLIDVLANDTDADSDPVSIGGITNPSHGTAVLRPNVSASVWQDWLDQGQQTYATFEDWYAATQGSVNDLTYLIEYTPDAPYSGTDSFSYFAEDFFGAQTYVTVTVTLTPVPDPANTADDSFTVIEDTPTTLDILANDTETSGVPFTLVSVSGAANGTVQIATDPADGVIYTRNTGFLGTDTFTYTVEDEYGTQSTSTVTVVVAPDPDNPIVGDDTYTAVTEYPLILDLLANDSSPASSDLTIISLSAPSDGTLTTDENGVITYLSNASFTGTETLTYTVEDEQGRQTAGTVTINVIPLPGAPGTTDDTFTMTGGTSSTLDVLANDTETDSTPFTVVDPGTATSGTVSIAADPADGIVYTPDTGFSGTDTFTYTVEDSYGTQSTAIVTVTVQAVPLVLTNDSVSMTNTGLPLLVDVLANDSGEGVALSSVTQPANGTVSIDETTGKLVYTAPDSGWSGTDTLTYTVVDNYGAQSTATVTMNVTADGGEGVIPNAVPVGGTDSATAMATQPVLIDVLANDTDANGNPIIIGGITEPSHGTAVLATNPADGIVYTPDADFSGTDTFSYFAEDSFGAQTLVTVTVTVTPLPDPANTVDDSYTVIEETTNTLDVLANDTETSGVPFTLVSVSGATNGSVQIAADPADGVIYTPNVDFVGSDSFTYTVEDQYGTQSTASVSITVDSDPDSPIAATDAYTVYAGQPLTLDLLNNDSSPVASALTIHSVSDPSDGIVTTGGNGDITYVSNAGFSGTETLTYIVEDAQGRQATGTVNITVDPVPDAPGTADDSFNVMEGIPVTLDVLANDTETDSTPFTLVSVSGASNGTVQIAADPADGVVYTPDASFIGADSFTYTVEDAFGTQSTSTVSITVDPLPGPANTVDDSFFVVEDTPTTLDVLANDTESDNTPFTLVSVTAATNGTVQIAANPADGVVYTPHTDFVGSDTFTYTVEDEYGTQSTASVTVTVTADPDNPITVNDSYTTTEQTPVVLNLMDNDSSPAGSSLTMVSMSAPAHGTIDGSYNYTADADFFGTETITYTVEDEQGRQTSATATINVMELTGTVSAADDDVLVEHINAVVTLDVLANDTESQDANLHIVSVTTPIAGSVTIIDGDESQGERDQLVFSPPADFTGSVVFTYTVENSAGEQSSATVLLVIQAPQANGSNTLYRGDGYLTLSNGFRVGAEAAFTTAAIGNFSVVTTDSETVTETYTDDSGIEHTVTTTWTSTATATNVDNADGSTTFTEVFLLDTSSTTEPVAGATADGVSSTTTGSENYTFVASVATDQTSYTYDATGSFLVQGQQILQSTETDEVTGDVTDSLQQTDWTDTDSYTTSITNTTATTGVLSGDAHSTRTRQVIQTDFNRTIVTITDPDAVPGEDPEAPLPTIDMVSEQSATWTWDTDGNIIYDIDTDISAVTTESRTGSEVVTGIQVGTYFYDVVGGRVDGTLDGSSLSTATYTDTDTVFHTHTVESSELNTSGSGTYAVTTDNSTRTGTITESSTSEDFSESTIVTTMTLPTGLGDATFNTTGSGSASASGGSVFIDEQQYSSSGTWFSAASGAEVAEAELGAFSLSGTSSASSTESWQDESAWAGAYNETTEEWDYTSLSGSSVQSGSDVSSYSGSGTYQYPVGDSDTVDGTILESGSASSAFTSQTAITGLDASGNAVITGSGSGSQSSESDYSTSGSGSFTSTGEWLPANPIYDENGDLVDPEYDSAFTISGTITESDQQHTEDQTTWESTLVDDEWQTTALSGSSQQSVSSAYDSSGSGTYSYDVDGGTVNGTIADTASESSVYVAEITITGVDASGNAILAGSGSGSQSSDSDYSTSGSGSFTSTGEWIASDEANSSSLFGATTDTAISSSFSISGEIAEADANSSSSFVSWQTTLNADEWSVSEMLGDTSRTVDSAYDYISSGNYEYDAGGGTVSGTVVNNHRTMIVSVLNTSIDGVDASGNAIVSGSASGTSERYDHLSSSGSGSFATTGEWLQEAPAWDENGNAISAYPSSYSVSGTVEESQSQTNDSTVSWDNALTDGEWTPVSLHRNYTTADESDYAYLSSGDYQYTVDGGIVDGTVVDNFISSRATSRSLVVDGLDADGNGIASGSGSGMRSESRQWITSGSGGFVHTENWHPDVMEYDVDGNPIGFAEPASPGLVTFTGTIDEEERDELEDTATWTTVYVDGEWRTGSVSGSSLQTGGASYTYLSNGQYEDPAGEGVITGTVINNHHKSSSFNFGTAFDGVDSEGRAVMTGSGSGSSLATSRWATSGSGTFTESGVWVGAAGETGTYSKSGSVVEGDDSRSSNSSTWQAALIDGNWATTSQTSATDDASESNFESLASGTYEYDIDGGTVSGTFIDNQTTSQSTSTVTTTTGINEAGQTIQTGLTIIDSSTSSEWNSSGSGTYSRTGTWTGLADPAANSSYTIDGIVTESQHDVEDQTTHTELVLNNSFWEAASASGSTDLSNSMSYNAGGAGSFTYTTHGEDVIGEVIERVVVSEVSELNTSIDGVDADGNLLDSGLSSQDSMSIHEFRSYGGAGDTVWTEWLGNPDQEIPADDTHSAPVDTTFESYNRNNEESENWQAVLLNGTWTTIDVGGHSLSSERNRQWQSIHETEFTSEDGVNLTTLTTNIISNSQGHWFETTIDGLDDDGNIQVSGSGAGHTSVATNTLIESDGTYTKADSWEGNGTYTINGSLSERSHDYVFDTSGWIASLSDSGEWVFGQTAGSIRNARTSEHYSGVGTYEYEVDGTTINGTIAESGRDGSMFHSSVTYSQASETADPVTTSRYSGRSWTEEKWDSQGSGDFERTGDWLESGASPDAANTYTITGTLTESESRHQKQSTIWNDPVDGDPTISGSTHQSGSVFSSETGSGDFEYVRDVYNMEGTITEFSSSVDSWNFNTSINGYDADGNVLQSGLGYGSSFTGSERTVNGNGTWSRWGRWPEGSDPADGNSTFDPVTAMTYDEAANSDGFLLMGTAIEYAHEDFEQNSDWKMSLQDNEWATTELGGDSSSETTEFFLHMGAGTYFYDSEGTRVAGAVGEYGRTGSFSSFTTETTGIDAEDNPVISGSGQATALDTFVSWHSGSGYNHLTGTWINSAPVYTETVNERPSEDAPGTYSSTVSITEAERHSEHLAATWDYEFEADNGDWQLQETTTHATLLARTAYERTEDGTYHTEDPGTVPVGLPENELEDWEPPANYEVISGDFYAHTIQDYDSLYRTDSLKREDNGGPPSDIVFPETVGVGYVDATVDEVFEFDGTGTAYRQVELSGVLPSAVGGGESHLDVSGDTVEYGYTGYSSTADQQFRWSEDSDEWVAQSGSVDTRYRQSQRFTVNILHEEDDAAIPGAEGSMDVTVEVREVVSQHGDTLISEIVDESTQESVTTGTARDKSEINLFTGVWATDGNYSAGGASGYFVSDMTIDYYVLSDAFASKTADDDVWRDRRQLQIDEFDLRLWQSVHESQSASGPSSHGGGGSVSVGASSTHTTLRMRQWDFTEVKTTQRKVDGQPSGQHIPGGLPDPEPQPEATWVTFQQTKADGEDYLKLQMKTQPTGYTHTINDYRNESLIGVIPGMSFGMTELFVYTSFTETEDGEIVTEEGEAVRESRQWENFSYSATGSVTSQTPLAGRVRWKSAESFLRIRKNNAYTQYILENGQWVEVSTRFDGELFKFVSQSWDQEQALADVDRTWDRARWTDIIFFWDYEVTAATDTEPESVSGSKSGTYTAHWHQNSTRDSDDGSYNTNSSIDYDNDWSSSADDPDWTNSVPTEETGATGGTRTVASHLVAPWTEYNAAAALPAHEGYTTGVLFGDKDYTIALTFGTMAGTGLATTASVWQAQAANPDDTPFAIFTDSPELPNVVVTATPATIPDSVLADVDAAPVPVAASQLGDAPAPTPPALPTLGTPAMLMNRNGQSPVRLPYGIPPTQFIEYGGDTWEKSPSPGHPTLHKVDGTYIWYVSTETGEGRYFIFPSEQVPGPGPDGGPEPPTMPEPPAGPGQPGGPDSPFAPEAPEEPSEPDLDDDYVWADQPRTQFERDRQSRSRYQRKKLLQILQDLLENEQKIRGKQEELDELLAAGLTGDPAKDRELEKQFRELEEEIERLLRQRRRLNRKADAVDRQMRPEERAAVEQMLRDGIWTVDESHLSDDDRAALRKKHQQLEDNYDRIAWLQWRISFEQQKDDSDEELIEKLQAELGSRNRWTTRLLLEREEILYGSLDPGLGVVDPDVLAGLSPEDQRKVLQLQRELRWNQSASSDLQELITERMSQLPPGTTLQEAMDDDEVLRAWVYELSQLQQQEMGLLVMIGGVSGTATLADVLAARGVTDVRDVNPTENDFGVVYGGWGALFALESSVVGHSVSFGGTPGVTINGEAADGQWVKRLVDGEWYYIPMDVYEEAFGFSFRDQPDDWDRFFREHGFRRVNPSDNLIPFMTNYDDDGNPTNYVNHIRLPPVWFNEGQEAENGTDHYGAALYFDADLNEFVYVDVASGMRLRQDSADPDVPDLKNDSPYERRHREKLKGTGVPEVDEWNRQLAQGKLGEFFLSQSGLGVYGAGAVAGVIAGAGGLAGAKRAASRVVGKALGTRKLPNVAFPWQKYQRHVTGRDYEEVWQLSERQMASDGRRAGYLIEVKWTGKNNAAWRSSPYNPNHKWYNEDKILDQVRGYIELHQANGGRGIRYAVSNGAARAHFEQLFREHFPHEMGSGLLRVFNVSGRGM